MDEQNNHVAVRDLLESWNLLELCGHFQDEGIDIEVLQLMKRHHVAELLQHFKMGVRIRFEHHFEKWRRDLNKPLCERAAAYLPCSAASSGRTVKEPETQARSNNSALGRVDTPECDMALLQPEVLLLPPSRQDFLREMPKLTPQPCLAASSGERTPPAPSPPAAPAKGAEAPLPAPVQFCDSADKSPMTLLHILQSSGVKGNSLLEHYQQHKQLTNAHRTLLIHLIVSYFENNDYHLSLNISHNLERQILKLFPTEKLENYRTEKRGKIYVKFCNMKRYKRDRTGLKRKWWDGSMTLANEVSKDAEVVDANEEDDDFPLGFEWAESQPPIEVQVKTENEESF